MIFIDSDVVTGNDIAVLVSELFIWKLVEKGDVVFCVTAGDALAVMGGRTNPEGGRVTPGATLGR